MMDYKKYILKFIFLVVTCALVSQLIPYFLGYEISGYMYHLGVFGGVFYTLIISIIAANLSVKKATILGSIISGLVSFAIPTSLGFSIKELNYWLWTLGILFYTVFIMCIAINVECQEKLEG